MPLLLTVAIAELDVLQTPPVTDADKAVVMPAQTEDAPEMAPALGKGLMVRLVYVETVPQLFARV